MPTWGLSVLFDTHQYRARSVPGPRAVEQRCSDFKARRLCGTAHGRRAFPALPAHLSNAQNGNLNRTLERRHHAVGPLNRSTGCANGARGPGGRCSGEQAELNIVVVVVGPGEGLQQNLANLEERFHFFFNLRHEIPSFHTAAHMQRGGGEAGGGGRGRDCRFWLQGTCTRGERPSCGGPRTQRVHAHARWATVDG